VGFFWSSLFQSPHFVSKNRRQTRHLAVHAAKTTATKERSGSGIDTLVPTIGSLGDCFAASNTLGFAGCNFDCHCFSPVGGGSRSSAPLPHMWQGRRPHEYKKGRVLGGFVIVTVLISSSITYPISQISPRLIPLPHMWQGRGYHEYKRGAVDTTTTAPLISVDRSDG